MVGAVNVVERRGIQAMAKNMWHARLAICTLGLVLATQSLHGQGRARYREFQLGGNLPSISALTGVAASAARTIHVRPATMQELEWQRPYSFTGTTAAQTDPVKKIVFSFYNDQLSRMVVDYDNDRTAGLNDTDLIDALSIEYGPRLTPAVKGARIATSRVEQESGTPVARWGDPDYAVVLYRSAYLSGFRIIVTSPRLEALARTAAAEAIRLDERDAPIREIARQKKETEDARASEEKARAANKAAFRP
jgi:hypothetical protein